MVKIVVIVLSLLGTLSLSGQKGYEIGGWIGASQYYGDLNSGINLKSPGLAGGIIGKYNVDTRLVGRVSINMGRIHADDKNSDNAFKRNRNLNFYSNVIEVNAAAEFNFFDYVHNVRDEDHTPYVLGGYSLLYHNPKTVDDNGEVQALRRLGTEGQEVHQEYSIVTGAFTLGLGYKWDINPRWNIAIEGSMRFTHTDYLDDVSTVYPDYLKLKAERGAEVVKLSNRTLSIPNQVSGKTGFQRGDASNKDSYLFLGVTLMRYFGSLDCPRTSSIDL